MINMDQFVIAFAKENIITLSLALGSLKIAAKMTKWVWDDQISTLLSGTLATIRGKPLPRQGASKG